MIIQHNMTSAYTNRMLGITNSNISKSSEKLSSGYRVNRAGDDAAGLTISEKMRGQIRGLERASDNAQDAISLIQTAEGAMNEIHSVLQRMRELTVQAANDTNVTADRKAIAKELKQLQSEIQRIASTTEFNTMKLIDGSFAGDRMGDDSTPANQSANADDDSKGIQAGAMIFQVGANEHQQINTFIGDMTISGIIANSGAYLPSASNTVLADGDQGDYWTTLRDTVLEGEDDAFADTTEHPAFNYANATKFVSVLDAAIGYVSGERSSLGSVQNRLEHTIANLDNSAENIQAAESRIRDVDMADEMVTYSKDGILQQAAQSMLAQANQAPQGVLSLLQ